MKNWHRWIRRFLFDTRAGDVLARAVERLFGLALVDLDQIEAGQVELVETD